MAAKLCKHLPYGSWRLYSLLSKLRVQRPCQGRAHNNPGRRTEIDGTRPPGGIHEEKRVLFSAQRKSKRRVSLPTEPRRTRPVPEVPVRYRNRGAGVIETPSLCSHPSALAHCHQNKQRHYPRQTMQPSGEGGQIRPCLSQGCRSTLNSEFSGCSCTSSVDAALRTAPALRQGVGG